MLYRFPQISQNIRVLASSFFFCFSPPRRSSVAAFKVCLHLHGYTNTVVAIPNSDDYEQLGVEGSHVRLVLPKHHLPDPVI